jgi:hypothetical protein
MKPLLAVASVLTLSLPTFAGPPSLRGSSPDCLEGLFRQGSAECAPSGRTHGTVVYADGRHPKLTARAQSTVWKGKTFHDDGTFTNRWLGGLTAISSSVHVEPSWIDGQPCLVMQYPPNTPVFGNVRDELRQIAPGLWLGRSYDAATGCPKNWFVLACN